MVKWINGGTRVVPETFLSLSELEKSGENKAVPVAQSDRAPDS